MTFTKLPKAISAEELLSTPLPPVKWIIPGLLPAGLALFAGPSKAGKSWLTLWLCLQIAQGNPVWNREIEPRTVVYFSLEDTFNRLQNRIFQLIDGGDAPERLILQTECPSIGQGLEEQMETSVYKGYKQDKIEMRGDRAEMSDFPLYLNTVAGGLDRRDQTIGGFSFVVKIYAVPVVEIIG